MQTKKCKYCEKEFETDNKQKVYCCKKCARAGYYKNTFVPCERGKKIVSCLHCDKEFSVNDFGRAPKYCSRRCKTTYNYRLKHPTIKGKCLDCGKEITQHIGKNGPVEKYCSQLCGDRYRRKLYPEKERRLANKPHRRYNIIRHGAMARNKEFNLTFEEFETFWNKPCKYCGDEIDGVGIDRINNEIGYQLDNCISCCGTCNKMKNKSSVADFFSHIEKIYKHNKTE